MKPITTTNQPAPFLADRLSHHRKAARRLHSWVGRFAALAWAAGILIVPCAALAAVMWMFAAMVGALVLAGCSALCRMRYWHHDDKLHSLLMHDDPPLHVAVVSVVPSEEWFVGSSTEVVNIDLLNTKP